MALVRVYCGLASADHRRPGAVGTWLTVAVVDDSGRLLDVCDFMDDPGGYAQLGTLLTERSNGPTGVAIAADSEEHLITMLLTAAGRPLTFADHDSVDDFAERFCDDESIEEMESPPAERRAIGLARALQAGALSAVALPTPRDMAALKPVLAAHAAVTVGRQAAAVALREVLRELYPAALRAYPDPAAAVPLAVLDALPEPGLVNDSATRRGRDATAPADAVAGQLAAAGIADAATIADAVTALRVAVVETPRRNGVSRSLTAAVAGTVREAVAAVRAWDAATDALIDALPERVNPPAAAPRPPVLRQRHAPAPTSAPPVAPLRAVRETTAEHETVRVPLPRRARSSPAPVSVPPAAAPGSPAGPTPAVPTLPVSPAHAAPMPPPPMPPPPMPPRAMPTGPAAPAMWPAAQTSAPPPPGQARSSAAATVSAPPFDARRAPTVPPPPPGITSMPPAPVSPAPAPVSPAARPTSPAAPFRATVTTGPPAGTRFATTDFASQPPPQRPAATAAAPGSRANWPLVGNTDDQGQELFLANLAPDPILGDPYASGMPAVGPSVVSHRQNDRQDDRVVPPWLADDLPLPPEPPMLRLVEPPPVADPALRRFGDDLSDSARFDPPPLRLVDSDGSERTSRTAARAGGRRPGPAPVSVPPVAEDGDGDLLIFAAARSAWFTGQAPEGEPEWGVGDDGWRAAEQAARPAVGGDTTAGLPKRVPQANLVPGSPLTTPDRPLRIVRDAASIAEHTSGYFSGWRRGQEIGGFAVGGRPGRESAQGWDFSRDPGEGEYDEDYRYPTAAYHSR